MKRVAFEGKGCAISKASASMMTQELAGKTVGQAREAFARFQKMLTGAPDAPAPSEMGELEVFSGVREFPMRVKCATMAWHTLAEALRGEV